MNNTTSDSPFAAVFKANDIRGVYPDSLNEDLVFLIGVALAEQAVAASTNTAAPRLAVGQDCRLSSPPLADSLMRGLLHGGVAVVNIGVVPTPALYYAAIKDCGGSGAMITGSHNPKNYNGIKMMMGGKTLKQAQIQTLHQRVLALHKSGAADVKTLDEAAAQRLIKQDMRARFIDEVCAANPSDTNTNARRLKIVVDAGNGAAGHFAPALYEAMGFEVIPLFCELDGNFPNHHPDPAQLKNLKDAQAAVEKHNADCAFVFDGDGDRLGLVLPSHPVIFADQLLMLFAKDILSRHPQTRVVFDVKCSALLAPWVEKHGGVADMQPTGHAFIKARMQETEAALGGEMSGHFYFKENWYGFDDALFAGARLARILAAQPSIFELLPHSVASPELQVDMSGQNQHEFIETLRANLSISDFTDGKQIVSIDGIRVEYEGGFGLVRASNTTPALVLRFEGSTQAQLDTIAADFRRALLAAGIDETRPSF